jgi:release factor glutamine methyltransferase
MTVANLLGSASALLRENGVATPGLDAGLLLGHVLRITRSALLAHGNDRVDADQCAAYHEAVGRRVAGESVAVITGRKEFRYLNFIVTKEVLVPRPDTETLVEAAIEKISANPAQPFSVLDLCTGSGAVGLSIKHEMPTVTVTLSDTSAAALNVARQNKAQFGLEAVIIQSDLFTGIRETFDLIVSNPPYIPSKEIAFLRKEVQNEPIIALDGGEDGLGLIRQIVKAAKARLNRNGYLMMEADPRQMTAIRLLLLENGYTDISVRQDMQGSDRVITAARPEPL